MQQPALLFRVVRQKTGVERPLQWVCSDFKDYVGSAILHSLFVILVMVACLSTCYI